MRFNRFRISFSAEVKLNRRRNVYRVDTSLPTRGSLSLSKQCFKTSHSLGTFPMETLFPPGCCLRVCSSLPSAFTYLALQRRHHSSTCTSVCVCPIPPFRRHIPAGARIGRSLPSPWKSYFPSPPGVRENSAQHSLHVRVSLWLSSLSAPGG